MDIKNSQNGSSTRDKEDEAPVRKKRTKDCDKLLAFCETVLAFEKFDEREFSEVFFPCSFIFVFLPKILHFSP